MAAGLADTVAGYADRYPDTKIILDHTGMPYGKLLRPILAQLEGLPDSAEWWSKVGAATWDRIRNRAWVWECNWPSERRPAKYFGETAKG